MSLIPKLTTALAAPAALALLAAPALAAAPYTVSGSPEVFTASGNTVITAGSQTWTCSDSSLTATPNTGTHSTGTDLADVTAASLTNCLWLGGIPTTVTVTSPSWHFNVADGDNTSGLQDHFTGSLTNISNVTITIPSTGCSFNVSGSVDGYFDEDNGAGGQELGVTSSDLTISGVNNAFLCLGLVSNGESATFTGTYDSTSQAINIS